MCVVCVCVCVCVCVYTGETGERVHYFTPTKSVSDLYSMHEEEYCNTHYTKGSWRKEREGQRVRGGRDRGGAMRGGEGEGW